jgi:hypothetical protein
MSDKLDVELIRWSIDARKAIQSAILNLATCHIQPNSLRAGQNAERFSALTGVAFSLWRAAFLASMETRPRLDERAPDSKETKSVAQTDHAADLLKTILASNAVGFGDDRRTDSWMGQYYIDNAAYRLSRYLEKSGPDMVPALVRRFKGYHAETQVPVDFASSAFAWMIIYAPFVLMLSDLMRDCGKSEVVEMNALATTDYKFVPRSVKFGEITSSATAELSKGA